MRKKVVLVTLALAALVAATLVGTARADRTYTLCDPSKSTLCSDLVALYEFNETASDYLRTSETGSAPLTEISWVDTAQTASGKLSYALNHAASANDGLYISRTAPFTGSFTMGFWLYVNTLPSANTKMVPLVWMAPVTASTEYVLGLVTPSVYPRVYLYNSSGTTYVRYEVKQTLTETTTYVQSTQSVSPLGLGGPGVCCHLRNGTSRRRPSRTPPTAA